MSYYISFLIFAVLAYLIATDSSIATFVDYVFKLIKTDYEKKKWWLLNNPRNPVVKYLMWRRSMKLTKELMDEYENK